MHITPTIFLKLYVPSVPIVVKLQTYSYCLLSTLTSHTPPSSPPNTIALLLCVYHFRSHFCILKKISYSQPIHNILLSNMDARGQVIFILSHPLKISLPSSLTYRKIKRICHTLVLLHCQFGTTQSRLLLLLHKLNY